MSLNNSKFKKLIQNFISKNENSYISIIIRYLLIVLLILSINFKLFISTLSKLFLYGSYFITNLFGSSYISGIYLHFGNSSFFIIKECLALNAYTLIAFLFLSIPLNLKLSSKILIKSFIILTFFNFLRIVGLMYIDVFYGNIGFEILHYIFYQGLSGIFVALIVIYYLKKEKIKHSYPMYSDLKYLFGKLRR